MKSRIYALLLCGLFAMLLAGRVEAATTINAVSCSKTDLNNAINGPSPGPAADGDTVLLPAMTCDWRLITTLAISNKSITISGAVAMPITTASDTLATALANAQAIETTCNNLSQTTYTCIWLDKPVITWTLKSTGNSTLKNIGWMIKQPIAPNCTGSLDGQVQIRGDSANFRATGNFFTTLPALASRSCSGLVATAYVRGVIDHNVFLNHNNVAHATAAFHDSWLNIGTHGDKSWAMPLNMGTAEELYTEDNIYVTDITSTGGGATFVAYHDWFGGLRGVHRFERYYRGQPAHHSTETRDRGSVSQENYRNLFSDWLANFSDPMSYRGVGTGRTFDNRATGSNLGTNRMLNLNVFRGFPFQNQSGYTTWNWCHVLAVTLSKTPPSATVTATATSTTGIPNGTNQGFVTITGSDADFNVTAKLATGTDGSGLARTFTYLADTSTGSSGSGFMQSPWDGNTDSTGYPCLDQPGRGTDSTLLANGGSNTTPQITVNGSTTISHPPQPSMPHLVWNNTINGGVSAAASIEPGSIMIVANRDFINQVSPFTGSTTAGIGRGTRESRPLNCVAGVYYWSTNGGGNWNTSTTELYSGDGPGTDGALDYCDSTNHWTDETNATCNGVNCYVPYTYPHPLVGAAADTLAPAAPTGITVQ